MTEILSITERKLNEILKKPKLPEPKEDASDNIDREQPKLQARLFRTLKWVVAVLLFVVMITILVLSQMTLAKTVSLLTNMDGTDLNNKLKGFLMLMFIVMVPNIFNMARCYLVGTFAKDATTYPWPNKMSLTIGFTAVVLETISISSILFFSGPYLHPDIFLLILGGIFSITIFLQVFSIEFKEDKPWTCIGKCCTFILSFATHIMALIGITIILIVSSTTLNIYNRNGGSTQIVSYVMLPITILILSILWSPNVQNLTIQPFLNLKTIKQAFLLKFAGPVANEQVVLQANARWKGGLIYSFVRFVAFFLISPIIFMLHNRIGIDFLFSNIGSAFNLGGSLSAVLAVNILFGLLAFTISYIACSICSQLTGFLIPLMLSTPLTVLLIQFWKITPEYSPWPHIPYTMLSNYSYSRSYYEFGDTHNMHLIVNLMIIGIGIVLIATQFAFTYNFFKNFKVVMATDDLLFLLPTYNPVFLPQYFLLNKRRERTMIEEFDGPFANPEYYNNAKIYICSTMYHESEQEMKNLLLSIKAVADAAANGYLKQTFESHIFFDGANQGRDLNMYAMRLISILEECFEVRLEEGAKRHTPYGIQLTWRVSNQLKFVIHCKNNKKVRNKKRWSQVMYMYYILYYRIPKDEGMEHLDANLASYEKTFILTTDADIVFTPESVRSLIELLSRDRTVGAVCARTHPLGSGPVVWYQVFDYAVGHWFQKVAENVLGSVLCCPGCFSLFRASALKDVVQIYASNVSLAKDFLTKDMGEDRWLCTLMVQHGWRLEYCAASENFTFCPDHFEEFYKQRRRWIPSTLANLFELVSSGSRIAKKNNYISYLFILYQVLNIASTLLSPGAVIIVLVGGLSIAFELNTYLTLAIQLGIAGGFMVTCLYTSQKTQLNTAKILTGVYAFMMTAVVVGLIGQGVVAVRETIESYTSNATDVRLKFLGGTLTSFTTYYIIFLSIVYTIAAVLHPFEAYQVVNFVWYIICLPSGYLLLIIYSFCNLTDRSWGTREATAKSETKSFGHYWKQFKDYAVILCAKCTNKKIAEKDKEKPPEEVHQKEVDRKSEVPNEVEVEVKSKAYFPESQDATNPCLVSIFPKNRNHLSVGKFLDNIGMVQYEEQFIENGYENLALVAKMDRNDLEAIGIEKRGHYLKILKAIKEIYVFESEIPVQIPNGIWDWLRMLSLPEMYAEVFAQEGYNFKSDMENLVGMGANELVMMGITKRGHLQRFKDGLKKLEYPTNDETRQMQAQEFLRKIPDMDPMEFEPEDEFWLKLRHEILKVDNSVFQSRQEAKLKTNLEELRNNYLLVLIIANAVWLLIFFLLDSAQFEGLRIESKINAVGLLFVLLYGAIYFIQFLCMMLHRIYTLMHFVADASYRSRGWRENGVEIRKNTGHARTVGSRTNTFDGPRDPLLSSRVDRSRTMSERDPLVPKLRYGIENMEMESSIHETCFVEK